MTPRPQLLTAHQTATNTWLVFIDADGPHYIIARTANFTWEVVGPNDGTYYFRTTEAAFSFVLSQWFAKNGNEYTK